jgi:hypothetical protein
VECEWIGHGRYLGEGEVLVNQERKDGAGHDDVREEEDVVLLVIRFTVRRQELHDVTDSDRRANKDNLHDGVVERQEVEEEVYVARQENQHVQELRFERHTWQPNARDVSI